MLAAVAGCAGPCTLTTPASAEILVPASVGEDGIRDAFTRTGWTLATGDAVHFNRTTDDGVISGTAFLRGDDRFLLTISAPLAELDAAQAEQMLAPYVGPVVAAMGIDAQPIYAGAREHCGAV